MTPPMSKSLDIGLFKNLPDFIGSAKLANLLKNDRFFRDTHFTIGFLFKNFTKKIRKKYKIIDKSLFYSYI